MRRGGNGTLLHRSLWIAGTDFREGYRKKLLIVAMTSRLICYFVHIVTDTFGHGDGVEDA